MTKMKNMRLQIPTFYQSSTLKLISSKQMFNLSEYNYVVSLLMLMKRMNFMNFYIN